jgi:hypothetical protein
MTTSGKSREREHDIKLASGSQAHLPGTGTLKIDGTDYTVPQIVQRLDNRVAVLDKATAAHAELKSAVTIEKMDRPAFKQFVTSLTSIVTGMYRNDPKTLADFDIALHKSTKPKVSVKNAAVEKSLATRAARHTMGKVQKKDIKGTPPATTTAPATSAPAPSPSPAPAPAAVAPAQLILLPVSMPAAAAQPATAPATSAATNGAAPQGSGPTHA